MKKKVPRLKTDRQAEAFLAQDLSGLDFAQFKPAKFEFEKKDDQINMRMPKPLLAAVKVLVADGQYKKILGKWGVAQGAIATPRINGATS